VGSDPFSYIHEDYRDHVRQQVASMLKKEITAPYQFCIYNKAGEIRWIMETVTPIDFEGKRATLGYFMDITQLRQMQRNLSTLGLSIGTISHSLKGCLTGLDASLYLIETGFYRDKPARIEEGLDVTKLMVDRIRKLVLDILYYAKERDLQLTTIDVWQFAKDVSTSIETRIRAADIHFICNFPADLGYFNIDTEILRPALLNILENAMEACIEDTRDKRHEIRLDVRGEDAQIIFEISDNGPGIESDQVHKIFRLFYSSKGNKGTGIGLFVTRKVINKHGGRISVDSQPGNGARFTIFLPRLPAETKF
jgi:signal transduction histidine kinase